MALNVWDISSFESDVKKNEGSNLTHRSVGVLLGRVGVLSRLFMAYHFKDRYRVVAFLQENRLLLSSMCKCAYPVKR